ncbi:MAG: hypothetical protein F6K38_36545 [Moorea sp. SIO3B2]|nr:hypothetical protein [Moorena sp. SIO3B2]
MGSSSVVGIPVTEQSRFLELELGRVLVTYPKYMKLTGLSTPSKWILIAFRKAIRESC